VTTWQDQQPPSRRALRESERAHAQATLSDTGETPITEPRSDQQIWPQPLTAEPLGYATRTRRATPAEEPVLRRPRSSGATFSAPESPSYRVRDFSPEGRGTSFSPTAPAPWTPPAAGSGDLDYHTSADVNRGAPAAFESREPVPPKLVTPAASVAEPITIAPEPVVPVAAEPDNLIEHTLTRRELRELRNVSQPEVIESAPRLDPEPAPQAATEPPSTARAPQAEMSPELAAAMAEFDALSYARSAPPLVEPTQSRRSLRLAPDASIPIPPPVAPALPSAPPPAGAPIAAIPPAPAPAPVQDPAEPVREVATAPEVYAAPANHWSVQASSEEQYADSVGPHRRNLAASDAITTNALVLSAFPQTGPLTGPVSGTGEILLTGSIDLPRSLGLNGLHPGRYDRADIDSVIDATDREDASPDSAPVRAIRAVSTHTSSQGIINAKRPKGNSLPMILSITAGVMAVGVIVLFVAGMIFKIF